MRTGSTPGGTAATLLQAVAVATIGVLPVFLLGALAVQIGDDLDVGPAEVGLGAAMLFTVTGVLARPLSRFVQRIGAARGVLISSSLAMAALIGIAAAPSFAVVIAALIVGGLANGMAHPAANLSISRAIGSKRLGLAFGIKQSAIPAAALLAGLAVPGIALVLGWRWAFVIGAVVAAAVAVSALAGGRGAEAVSKAGDTEVDRGTPFGGLVVLAVGAGLAAAAATAMGVFLVGSAVNFGIPPSQAGLLAAGAALLGLSIRIFLGAAVDRHPGRSPYVLIANLLTVGTGGYVLLSIGSTPWFVAGAVLAYSAGWTWPGLLHFAIVRDNRQAAASATGVLQTGMSLGAASGPLLFGLIVEAASYNAAWLAAAVAAVLAAITFRSGRWLIRRSRGLPVRTIRGKSAGRAKVEKSR